MNTYTKRDFLYQNTEVNKKLNPRPKRTKKTFIWFVVFMFAFVLVEGQNQTFPESLELRKKQIEAQPMRILPSEKYLRKERYSAYTCYIRDTLFIEKYYGGSTELSLQTFVFDGGELLFYEKLFFDDPKALDPLETHRYQAYFDNGQIAHESSKGILTKEDILNDEDILAVESRVVSILNRWSIVRKHLPRY